MAEKPSLSLENQALIRRYLLRLVALPGAASIVIASFLGYLINDVGVKSAYQDAYSVAFSNVVEVIGETATTAATAAAQAESARESALRVQRELDEVSQAVAASELLTSTDLQISEIAGDLMGRPEFLARVNGMQQLREFDRQAEPVHVDVPGGTGWGRWYEESYCPRNHYVCGLSQRVEGAQGRGDDTSVNDLQMVCCPLFGE